LVQVQACDLSRVLVVVLVVALIFGND